MDDPLIISMEAQEQKQHIFLWRDIYSEIMKNENIEVIQAIVNIKSEKTFNECLKNCYNNIFKSR